MSDSTAQYSGDSRLSVDHYSKGLANWDLPYSLQSPAADRPPAGGDRQGQSDRHSASPAESPAESPPPKPDTAGNVLPKVEIVAPTAKREEGNWFSGALHVVEDLAVGAYKEVTEHPLQVVEAAAIGVGVGVVATVAAPVAIAVGIGGAAYAGYQVYEHGGQWLNDISIVANENGHSQEEIALAHKDVQGLGAGTALALAGLAGSFAGSELTGAWLAAESSPGAGIGVTRGEAPVASELPRITRPGTNPFTLDRTTMSVGNQGNWSAYVDKNGGTDIGAAILNYVNRWGTMMEEQLAQGRALDSSLFNSTSLAADTEGMSGYTASIARQVLIQTWKYGSKVRGFKLE